MRVNWIDSMQTQEKMNALLQSIATYARPQQSLVQTFSLEWHTLVSHPAHGALKGLTELIRPTL